jgi:hypothetical protein
LTGRAVRTAPSSASISSTSRVRRASSPTIAKPAYGVRLGSSAPITSRPRHVAPLLAFTRKVTPPHRQGSSSHPVT